MKNILFALFVLYSFSNTVHAADFFAARSVGLAPMAGECVGNTEEPLCVFDTVVACAVRAQPNLCESVGLKYDNFFKNSMVDLAGRDYKYNPVEMYVNRRTPACAVDDGRACVTNPYTGEIVAVDMSIKDNNNVAVFLRRVSGGRWSVIFATQYACWSDEDCS